MDMDYWKHHYRMSAQESNEKISVEKNGDGDWCHVSMITNDRDNGKITIRSKAMAEQLHFMLGQMLNRS